MHPIAFRVGGFEVYTWGILFAAGVLIGVLVAERNARRFGMAPYLYLEGIPYVIVGAMVGARLLYVAAEWSWYAADPRRLLYFREGGLSLYGGLAGGVLAAWLVARARKVGVAPYLDGGSPGIALATAVSRVGCFLNGCCWGVLTGGTWGARTRFAPGLRHPAQLYEAALDLALFAVLWMLGPRLARLKGHVFLAYLGGYSLIRFGVEFVRDVPHIAGWLTVTQPLALVVALASFGLMWWGRKRQLDSCCWKEPGSG
ncbi:MAG: prolipoprotein diacylglyceryl transferase [Bacillota bacterium]|nr:prolipoprotein diacylglyceryl transferase [Bacillota bacterium]